MGLFADPAYTDVSNTLLFNGLLPTRVTPTCLASEAILTPTPAQITETKSASGFIYGVSHVPTMTGNMILTDFLTEQCCGFHWVICWTLSQINCRVMLSWNASVYLMLNVLFIYCRTCMILARGHSRGFCAFCLFVCFCLKLPDTFYNPSKRAWRNGRLTSVRLDTSKNRSYHPPYRVE